MYFLSFLAVSTTAGGVGGAAAGWQPASRRAAAAAGHGLSALKRGVLAAAQIFQGSRSGGCTRKFRSNAVGEQPAIRQAAAAAGHGGSVLNCGKLNGGATFGGGGVIWQAGGLVPQRCRRRAAMSERHEHARPGHAKVSGIRLVQANAKSWRMASAGVRTQVQNEPLSSSKFIRELHITRNTTAGSTYTVGVR